MIRTLEAPRLAVDAALGERCEAVRTCVRHHAPLAVIVPPRDVVCAEELQRRRPLRVELPSGDGGDNAPIPAFRAIPGDREACPRESLPHARPELFRLLLPGEKIPAIARLLPEQLLLRWVNHHLRAFARWLPVPMERSTDGAASSSA